MIIDWYPRTLVIKPAKANRLQRIAVKIDIEILAFIPCYNEICISFLML